VTHACCGPVRGCSGPQQQARFTASTGGAEPSLSFATLGGGEFLMGTNDSDGFPEDREGSVRTVRRGVDALVEATRQFIRTKVIPLDDDFDGDIHAAGGDHTRIRLQAAARQSGLLAPHGPVDCGGHG
jgi:alkylation response protein AidB-like acyl-CoA dehydrogenase